jgi:hypothetical protein
MRGFWKHTPAKEVGDLFQAIRKQWRMNNPTKQAANLVKPSPVQARLTTCSIETMSPFNRVTQHWVPGNQPPC